MKTKVRSHSRKTKRKTAQVRMHTRRVKSPKGLSTKQLKELLYYNVQHDLKKKGKARIPEIGTIKIKRTKARKARMGINPFTKQKVLFKAKPAGRKLKFYASKRLKEAL